MASLAERGPIDDPDKSPEHRAFQEYLEREGRTEPKIRNDISNGDFVSASENHSSSNRPPEAQPPVVKRGESGDVTINMAGLVIAYNENDPAAATFLPGRATEPVQDAAKRLYLASVRLRTLPSGDVRKKIALIAHADAAARLLELGRPDVTQATRLLFDSSLPGLPPRPGQDSR
jgi:hypothetical protein